MINEKIKQRFDKWWNCEKTDRPMIRVLCEKSEKASDLIDLRKFKNFKDFHINPEFRVGELRNTIKKYDFLYEAFPYIDINMGPGSMAGYLGLEPQYEPDTVWYKHIMCEQLQEIPKIKFDGNNKIWKEHLSVVKKAVELAKGEFFVAIPDILENIDVLSLLRGNEPTCFDLMDCPETVKEYLDDIADIYMNYFDKMYELTNKDREVCYTAFSLWARDKVAKIQCDFSCLLSCVQFDEFVLPYLLRQTEKIPYTMYHLDGKDAIRHLPSLMKLQKLNALQWTSGAGQPDGGCEKWFPIYDAVIESGKSLWISFCDGEIEEMVQKAKVIAKRYDNKGLYFHFPPIKSHQKKLLENAFGKCD